MKLKLLSVALLSFIVLNASAQNTDPRIHSKIPCAGAEAFKVADVENWEEIIVCNLNPHDSSTWSWHYNYRGNKRGLQKINVLSRWQKDDSGYLLVKIENNPNKYRLSFNKEAKGFKMEKVEGNMALPYSKEFEKVF